MYNPLDTFSVFLQFFIYSLPLCHNLFLFAYSIKKIISGDFAMNFLWFYILACCCNKNNTDNCHEHKKQHKSCHTPHPQENCSCSEKTPPPTSCHPKPVKDCQTPPPPPPGCQPPPKNECPCQEKPLSQEIFQNQGRFCQHPF